MAVGHKLLFFAGLLVVLQQVLAAKDEKEASKTVYKIQVTTANTLGAGTDANVFIRIFGSTGVTAVHRLHKGGNQFEKGHTDTFFIEDIMVGKLEQIAIKRDKKWWYILSPWKLESITVRSYEPIVYKFVFNQWIPPNKWIQKHAVENQDMKNDEEMFDY